MVDFVNKPWGAIDCINYGLSPQMAGDKPTRYVIVYCAVMSSTPPLVAPIPSPIKVGDKRGRRSFTLCDVMANGGGQDAHALQNDMIIEKTDATRFNPAMGEIWHKQLYYTTAYAVKILV